MYSPSITPSNDPSMPAAMKMPSIVLRIRVGNSVASSAAPTDP
jgi:hypothetical protein